MADVAQLKIEIVRDDVPKAVSALAALEARAARVEQQLNSFSSATQRVFAAINQLTSSNQRLGQAVGNSTAFLAGQTAALNRAAQATQTFAQAQTAALNQISGAQANYNQNLANLIAARAQLADTAGRGGGAGAVFNLGPNLPAHLPTNPNAANLSGTLQGLGSAIQGVAAALAFGAVKQFGEESTEAALKIDSLKRALTAITGSAKLADDQLVRLREIAKLPGLGFEESVRGAVRLQAVGFSAADAERALKAFGKAIALTGGGAEQLNSITVQLAQLTGKGKVLAQDLKPIIEAAPAVGKALASIFGTVDSEQIQHQLERTGKSAQDFVKQLVGALEKLRGVEPGPREALKNFSVTVQLAFAKVGDVVLRLLVPALGALGTFLELLTTKFAALPSGVQTALVILTALAPILGTVVLGAGALVLGLGALAAAYSTLTTVITAHQAVILASLGTFTTFLPVLAAVGLVVGVLVTAWLTYESTLDRALKITKDQIESASQQLAVTKSLQNEVAFLAQAQQLSGIQHQQFERILGSLDSATQSYIRSLSSEKDRLDATKRALEENRAAQEGLLRAQQTLLIAAFIEQQQKVDNAKAIEKLAAAQARQVAAAIKAGEEFVLIATATGYVVERATDAQKRAAVATEAANKALVEESTTRKQLGAALIGNALGLGDNAERLQILAKASGFSNEQVKQLGASFRELQAAQAGAGGAIDTVSDKLRKQAIDLNGLQAATRKQTIEALFKAAAEAAAQAGEGPAGAIKRFKEAAAFLPDIGKAIKDENLFERNLKALEGQLKTTTSNASSQAEALLNAQLSFQKESVQGNLQAIQDATRASLAELQRFYDQGRIAAETFFGARASIENEGIDAQIKALRQEAGAIASVSALRISLASTINERKVEKLQFGTKILDISNKIKDLERQKTDNIGKANAELEKQQRLLFNLLAEQGAASGLANAPQIDPLLEKRKAELEAIRSKGALLLSVSDLEASLARRELAIQNDVQLGLRSEANATQALTNVRRTYRDQILATLEVELAYARFIEPENARRILDIETQIERTRTLGEAIKKQRSFAAGLLDDSGEFKNNLFEAGRQVQEGIKNAIITGFKEGGAEGVKSLLEVVQNVLLRILADRIYRIFSDLLSSLSKTTQSPGGGQSTGLGILGTLLKFGVGLLTGNLFAGGGNFGNTGSTTVGVSAGTGGIGYAAGGYPSGGFFAGERGIEYIEPKQTMRVYNNSETKDMMRGRRLINVNVTINTPDAQSFRQSDSQVRAQLARAIGDATRDL